MGYGEGLALPRSIARPVGTGDRHFPPDLRALLDEGDSGPRQLLWLTANGLRRRLGSSAKYRRAGRTGDRHFLRIYARFWMKSSRSAFTCGASVVHMPCGAPGIPSALTSSQSSPTRVPPPRSAQSDRHLVQDQRGHLDLSEIFRKVGLRKCLDRIVLALVRPLHSCSQKFSRTPSDTFAPSRL